jgi:hypothetical protein
MVSCERLFARQVEAERVDVVQVVRVAHELERALKVVEHVRERGVALLDVVLPGHYRSANTCGLPSRMRGITPRSAVT